MADNFVAAKNMAESQKKHHFLHCSLSKIFVAKINGG